jgi:uncharacterized protein (DUF2164 family)
MQLTDELLQALGYIKDIYLMKHIWYHPDRRSKHQLTFEIKSSYLPKTVEELIEITTRELGNNYYHKGIIDGRNQIRKELNSLLQEE